MMMRDERAFHCLCLLGVCVCMCIAFSFFLACFPISFSARFSSFLFFLSRHHHHHHRLTNKYNTHSVSFLNIFYHNCAQEEEEGGKEWIDGGRNCFLNEMLNMFNYTQQSSCRVWQLWEIKKFSWTKRNANKVVIYRKKLLKSQQHVNFWSIKPR